MRRRIRKVSAYGLAIALVAIATLLTLWIEAVRLRAPYLPFTIAVMASAAWGGFGAGAFAVLLSSLAAVYFLIEPIYAFRIADPESSLPLAMFAAVGLTISWGVTLLTRARQQADESRKRFHSAFVDAHIGFALADAHGRLIEVNRALSEITGYTGPELLSQQLRDITHPDDREESGRLFGQVATNEVPSAIYEERYLTKDGRTVWVRSSAAVLLGSGGSPNRVITLVEDITPAKRLEEELRQAQKMEAVGRLAGGVAHDFNNLLTVIGGYSRMLLAQSAAMPVTSRDPLVQIVEAADRATALTRQLLAFSRQRATEPRKVEINGLVANLERLLKRILGEDMELVLSLAPASLQVLADPTQIEQVIMNLAVNARDAMPAGGRLTIATGRATVDEALAARHFGLAPGEYVLLTVTDNGSGMTPEVQAHLFEPFFTTKEPGKGTGLGLSIVYGIMQQQGGKVLVYSEEGKGTTFKLFFPQVLLNGEVPAVAPVAQAPRSGGETILLVEDERGVRDYVRAVLDPLGYTLLVAADGAEALNLAGSYPGEINLLLSDVVMPRMNGPQLAARLRELRPGIKVLFMSGYAELAMRPDVGPGEATIQKPFSASSIAQRVREILDRS